MNGYEWDEKSPDMIINDLETKTENNVLINGVLIIYDSVITRVDNGITDVDFEYKGLRIAGIYFFNRKTYKFAKKDGIIAILQSEN